MAYSPTRSRTIAHLSSPLIAAVLVTGVSASWPIVEGAFAPVLAQERVAVSAEFRTALQPFGRWEHHSRWGDVWIPASRPRDWRPYTVGRWDYTDDWGWYWVADQEEDSWGWIVYHYGHWVLDADFGWVWVPGTQWSPGWVQWRRGAGDIGWAPLPPEEIITEYRDQPSFWIFVRTRDFAAPRMASVLVPVREYDRVIRETVVVNRTVELSDRRIAVNPGISADIVAAAVGHPLRSFEVHPRVLAGTAKFAGAVEVRAQDVARQRGQALPRETIRETQNEIKPAARIPEPQALGEREQGRLGANPPKAARGANLQEGQPAREQQGATPQERRQPPSTQGVAPREQQQQGAAPQERRQPPITQGTAPREQQGAAPQQERRQPPSTQGLGGGGQREAPQPQIRAPQEQPRTEGRGGGAEQQRGGQQRRPPG